MTRQLQHCMCGGLLIATAVAVGLTLMALGAAPMQLVDQQGTAAPILTDLAAKRKAVEAQKRDVGAPIRRLQKLAVEAPPSQGGVAAPCSIINPQGTLYWGQLGLPMDTVFKMWADPAGCGGYGDPGCGNLTPYNFLIESVDIVIVDASAFGLPGDGLGTLTFSVDIECPVTAGDPCSMPGVEKFKSPDITLVADDSGYYYINVPVGVCVGGPFFVSVHWRTWTGWPDYAPSILWDSTNTMPRCRQWWSLDGGTTWTDHHDFFNDGGWAGLTVSGDTNNPCSPGQCPLPVCGDGVCDPGEDQCNCPADCGTPPPNEVGLCSDGIDNDCDCLTDCDDGDCDNDPVCADGPQTCPANTLYGQDPHQPADLWVFGTSDNAPVEQFARFESFPVPADPICDIHWWGADREFVPGVGFVECTEDPMSFWIDFYDDDGAGMPGSWVCSYSVSVTGVPGPQYGGITQKYYSVDLTPLGCCTGFSTTTGWVSIQGHGGDPNCWFLWLSSPTGDGSSVFFDGSSTIVEDYDLSLCLTGAQIGACCWIAGTCTVGTLDNCNAIGGTYQGDGTSCTPNPCPPPTGACCFADGTCTVETLDDCNALGGTPGVLSSCTPNPCPQPSGACCFGDGNCQILTAFNCAIAFGSYQGDGTSCTPNPCPQAGACCFAEDWCEDGHSQTSCSFFGGTYQGDGTDCATTNCPPPSCGSPVAGDCCVANGTPGCDDATCCAAICALDPFCCDVNWDTLCANAAAGDPVNCPQCVPCPADLDNDGDVNSADLTLLLGAWAAGTTVGDIDGDGDTDSADLTLLLGAWAAGGCP